MQTSFVPTHSKQLGQFAQTVDWKMKLSYKPFAVNFKLLCTIKGVISYTFEQVLSLK